MIPKAKIVSVQVLRGGAVGLVLFSHALFRMREQFANTSAIDALVSHLGQFGVYIFFVISGFIMVHTSGKLFGHSGAGFTFFLRRVTRIVPLYAIFTCVEYALRLRKAPDFMVLPLVKSLFFVPYVTAPSGYFSPLLSQGWTLNYEMFFYLVFASCLGWPYKRALSFFTALFFCIVIACRLLVGLNLSGNDSIVSFFGSPIQLLFIAGVWLGFAHEYLKRRRKPFFILPQAMALLISLALIAGTLFFMESKQGEYAKAVYNVLMGFMSILLVALCLLEKDKASSVWIDQAVAFLAEAGTS